MEKFFKNNLKQIIYGVICLAFFTLAVYEVTRKTHRKNTEYADTPREGSEPIGDYFTVSGPDLGNVSVYVIFGMVVLWFGFFNKK